jgi:hypothetical protein
MGTTSTITIDASTKLVTFSSQVMGFRELVTVKLYNTGASTATDLKLAVVHRKDILATSESFTDEGGYFQSTISLNTEEIEAFFDAERDGQRKRTFDLALIDSSKGKLLINDKITVMNNPYNPDMQLSTEV